MQIDSFMQLPKDKRPPECLHPDTHIFVKIGKFVRYVDMSWLWTNKDKLSTLYILSHTGWKKILNIRKMFIKDAQEINIGNVYNVICSSEHRFPISSRGKTAPVKLQRANGITVSSPNYYHNYFLHSTVERFLNTSISRIQGLELNYDLGYLLGIYAAEGGYGFNTARITMNTNERGTLEKLARLVTKLNAKRVRVFRNKSDKLSILRLKFSSKKLKLFLTSLCKGKCKNKILNMNIILNTPREFREGIFNGYIDGDGHKTQEGTTTFSSASQQLRDSMVLLASSIGRLFTKRERDWYDARYDSNGTCFSSYSRDGGSKRKHRLVNGLTQLPTKCNNKLTINTHFIDLEVEDGIFLIDTGILTHNSMWDKPEEVENWLDRVYDRDKSTHIDLMIDDIEG